MSITGVFLLFKKDMFNTLLCAQVQEKNVDLEDVSIQNFSSTKRIDFYEEECSYYQLHTENSHTFYTTFTAQELTLPYERLIFFIQALHYKLLLHKYLLVFFGLLLLYLLLSGVYLAQKYTIKKLLSNTSRSFNKNTHILLGIIFFPFLFVFVSSGVFLPLHKQVTHLSFKSIPILFSEVFFISTLM